MPQIITKSSQETFEFAKKIASKLRGGEVIALFGDLGAGKTVFTQGLASGLGLKKNINSPTFVVMKVYENKKGIGLVHVDAYRLQGGDDLVNMGAGDYISSKRFITVIEWPENVKKFLPKKVLRFRFHNTRNDRERKIIF